MITIVTITSMDTLGRILIETPCHRQLARIEGLEHKAVDEARVEGRKMENVVLFSSLSFFWVPVAAMFFLLSQVYACIIQYYLDDTVV